MRELIKNERLKLYRRRSTKVMLILMAVLIALACFAYVAIGAAEFLDDGYYEEEELTWQQLYTREMQYVKDSEEGIENAYTASYASSEDAYWSVNHAAGEKYRVELIRYLIDNDISPERWENDLWIDYYEQKAVIDACTVALRVAEEVGEEDFYHRDMMAEAQATADRLMGYLKAADWRAMLKQRIADDKADGTPSALAEAEVLELELEIGYEPIATDYIEYTAYQKALAGDDTAWKIKCIGELTDNLERLNGAKSEWDIFDGRGLSATDRAELEKQNRLLKEQLRTDRRPVTIEDTAGLMDSGVSAVSICTIFIVVLAGGIVASEYSSGTVKLLLITPHRRRKIYWSKAIVILELILLLWPFTFLVSWISAGVFCHFRGLFVCQLVEMGSRFVSVPYLLIVFLKYGLALLPTVLFGSMALMFSTVLRRSAPAIAIPLLINFMGSTLVTGFGVIFRELAGYALPGQRWLLFSALNPAATLPSLNSEMGNLLSLIMAELGLSAGGTLTSCLLVLGFHIVCFLWIGRDDFEYRDI